MAEKRAVTKNPLSGGKKSLKRIRKTKMEKKATMEVKKPILKRTKLKSKKKNRAIVAVIKKNRAERH